MTLTTHHLAFTATAVTPLELDDQAGASIRGAVVGGLWGRFCANKAAPTGITPTIIFARVAHIARQ